MSANVLHVCSKCLALTASFFGNVPMPTPTKSQNPTIVGSGDLDIAQMSHPSKLRYNYFQNWHLKIVLHFSSYHMAF